MAAVLVAYATKYGSTREVAEKVAERLREHGLQVEAHRAHDVRSLDGYDAVVFGGAIYMFRLVAEGRRFLRRHRKKLSGLPVAVFGMGPIEDEERQYVDARRHLDKTLLRLKDVSPQAVTVFGGAFDPAKLKFPYNNPGIKAMPPADLRDWQAIEAWADSLAPKLGAKSG
jgi:menaquinone-dependent protoporphyrinogen oxidase